MFTTISYFERDQFSCNCIAQSSRSGEAPLKVRIIIQARLTSARLPGKALLPVAGYPSAILAALRGSNKKHSIILATSDDPSDDRLVEEACHHKLHVFRGPLHDVIARYFWAAADLAD